jgi:hypothetical protein
VPEIPWSCSERAAEDNVLKARILLFDLFQIGDHLV